MWGGGGGWVYVCVCVCVCVCVFLFFCVFCFGFGVDLAGWGRGRPTGLPRPTELNYVYSIAYTWPVHAFISPQNGGLQFDVRTSVRTYVRPYVRPSVRGQRFLRSVWVNWFETLGQEQVRSEDYARQIDFWYSKWRPGGHLGCKQTWSRNSNNTN